MEPMWLASVHDYAASRLEADRLCRSGREIQGKAFDKRTPVVDANRDVLSRPRVGYKQASSKGKDLCAAMRPSGLNVSPLAVSFP